MNEEFDDRLKNRIADVFDNYEDESANEGWALLREKYPEEKKRRGLIWLWWGSAAAILLVVLGLGIWMNQGTNVKPTLAHHTQKTEQNTHQDNDIVTKTTTTNNRTIAKDTQTNNTAAKIAATTPIQAGNQATSNQTKNSVASTNWAKRLAKADVNIQYKKTADVVAKTAKSNNKAPNITVKQNEQDIAANSTKQSITHPEAKAVDSAILASNNTNTQKTLPTETIKPIVKENKPPIFTALKPNDIKVDKPVDKAVKFGLYAATYFNYAKGSDNRLNVGAGFSSEIKLSKRLKLLTGMVIGQNSLNYTAEVPQKANDYVVASIANEKKSLYAGAAAAAAPPQAGFAALSVVNVSVPTVKNYQANLLALDIPINLKYQITKSDTYIAAGLSSGTYLVETYDFGYNYSSGYLSKNDQQSTQTRNYFNTFDFARTLNLAFGVGYPVGKNRLVVEPFVKYPLSGLGSQDLKFGAGGINLKFNFSASKKVK